MILPQMTAHAQIKMKNKIKTIIIGMFLISLLGLISSYEYTIEEQFRYEENITYENITENVIEQRLNETTNEIYNVSVERSYMNETRQNDTPILLNFVRVFHNSSNFTTEHENLFNLCKTDCPYSGWMYANFTYDEFINERIKIVIYPELMPEELFNATFNNVIANGYVEADGFYDRTSGIANKSINQYITILGAIQNNPDGSLNDSTLPDRWKKTIGGEIRRDISTMLSDILGLLYKLVLGHQKQQQEINLIKSETCTINNGFSWC